MLGEGSAPMAAQEACAETVSFGRRTGGDEGKEVQRGAVDVDE